MNSSTVITTTDQLPEAVLGLAAYSRISPEAVLAKLEEIQARLLRVGSPNATILADIISKKVGAVRITRNSHRIYLVSLLIWAGGIDFGML